MNHYELDSVGWGSPFLLVPEATSVDKSTRELLAKATEDDFYLSHISPLGVPFDSVKGTSNSVLKNKRIQENNQGSSCPKKFLALRKEFDPKGICTASKKYQDFKLQELDAIKDEFSVDQLKNMQNKITEKSCLCVGLANASYLENDIPIKGQDQGIVICPGPNLAYFHKEVSLSKMVQHIYGNENIMTNTERPNLFVNELRMYVVYLKNEINELLATASPAALKKYQNFKNNLLDGIAYYEVLFATTNYFETTKASSKKQLEQCRQEIHAIAIPIQEQQ